MALSALTLAISSGSIGRPFAATLIGATAGSRFSIHAPASGFYVRNGRLVTDSLPNGTTSVTVRERGADGTYLDTVLTVTAATTDVLDDVQVPAIPANITAAGSVTITGGRAGATLALATNPDGAWTLAANVLSWSTAAIGKPGRPSIAQTFTKPAPAVALETIIPPGAGVAAVTAPGTPTIAFATPGDSLKSGTAASGVTLINAPATGAITLLINGASSGLTVSSTGATRTITGTPAASGALTATGAVTGALGAVVSATSLASAAVVVTRSGVSYSAPLTALAA